MRKFVVVLILLASVAKGYDNPIAQANIYYQRPNSAEIQMNDIEHLDDKTNIKIIIHGTYSSRRGPGVVLLGIAYLAQGIDNVFMADWGRAASKDYEISTYRISKVALRFGHILSTFMMQNGIDPNEVHLIGFSMGAHIAGQMGRYFNGSLGRITGLDPALHQLFNPQSLDSLRSSDGKFVDVIHTDYPVRGDQTPRGRADFYPNRGRSPQPGCNDANYTGCSHNRALLLYAESIGMPMNFPAIPCSLPEIQLHKVKQCKTAATLNTTVMMGENLDKSAIGQFYLETSAAPPYGLGYTVANEKNANGHINSDYLCLSLVTLTNLFFLLQY